MTEPSIYHAAKTLMLMPSNYWGRKPEQADKSLEEIHKNLFTYIEEQETDFDRVKTLIALIDSKPEQLTYLDTIVKDIIKEMEILTLTDEE